VRWLAAAFRELTFPQAAISGSPAAAFVVAA